MHVDTDLSAYLDGELDPSDRARVVAHLETCDRCAARLEELRATASLVASLPTVRPSRSLVPRAERFNWLRPARSFSAAASGAFLFVFLVTAIARGGGGLGGGSPTGAFTPVAQPAATAAPAGAAEAARAQAGTGPPALRAPVPAAAPAPATTTALDAALSRATVSPAAGFAAQATAAPKAAEAATPSAPTRAEDQATPQVAVRTARGLEQGPSPLSDPLVWLGLAVIAAVVAIGAHLRLRTT